MEKKSMGKGKKLLIALGVLIVIIAVASSTGGNKNTSANSTSSTASNTQPVEKVYAVNELVPTSSGIEVTVTKVDQRDSVGSTYIQKEVSEGGVFICIDYKMKNASDEPIGSFSFPSIQLIDEKGTTYDADIDASSSYAIEKDNNGKILSDLNPGITTVDSNVFEISKELYNSGKWYVLIDNSKKVALN